MVYNKYMEIKRTNINLKPDSQRNIMAIRQATGKRTDITIIDHGLDVTVYLIKYLPHIYDMVVDKLESEHDE